MRFRILLALVAMLVFAMTGVAAATEATGKGTLEFEHDIAGGPAVHVVVVAFLDTKEDPIEVDNCEYGETLTAKLPVGTHGIVILSEDGPIGAGEFEITADETTTVKASSLEASPSPEPSPSASPTATATDDDDDDDEIETPDRVETGAGGSADGGSGLTGFALLGGATALTAAGVALRARRRSV